MSDFPASFKFSELFDLPKSPLPPLEAARKALVEYEKTCTSICNQKGGLPIQMVYHLEALKSALLRLEQEALRK